MLREARITMPHHGTDLCSTVHQKLGEQLAAAFGGFTCFQGTGGWVDPSSGDTLVEPVFIYDVAIDSERDSPTDLIARFAIEAGEALDQTSVYVRYPNGAVDIIKIVRSEKEEKAARLAEALSEPLSDYEAEGAKRFLDSLLCGGGFVVVADMGDGRSAVEPELFSAEELMKDEAKPGGETSKLAPGQLWATRGGGRAAVGRRATIMGGGFYVTLVDNQLPYRAGFEYTVDKRGLLIHPDNLSVLDLVAHIY